MPKKHIEKLTHPEINYAVAVALEKECLVDSEGCKIKYESMFSTGWEKYHPTTNQEQCGKIIDEFKITCRFFSASKEWCAWKAEDNNSISSRGKSRLVAACKAFLWSKYPDGMVDVD